MGNLRPIGSEKLQGMDKINRIIEISRYNENRPNPINEDKSVEYTKTLADGKTYRIDREKNGYVIKKTISESTNTFDYVEPMKNRKYYSSYSQALKRLNLIVKEVNSNEGYTKSMSLFNESEDKESKYVIKVGGETKEQAAPTPAPAPVPAPAPAPSPAPVPTDDMGGEMPDDMGDEMEPEEGDDEPITLKVIQKLTGKLAQKLRGFEENNEEPMTSKDIKYVINSILSAVDIESIEEDDIEDIMNKLEGVDDEEGMGDEMGDEMGDLEGMTPEEPTGEVAEEFDVDYEEDYGFVDDFETDAPTREKERIKTPERERERERERETEKPIRRLPNPYDPGKREEELPNPEAKRRGRNTPEVHGGGDRQKHFYEVGIEGRKRPYDVQDFNFSLNESKVDKVLSKYFITENESKTKKPINENYRKQSVNVIQEMMSVKFKKKYPNSKFVGKTNKDNLVFEHNNKQIRITPKGNII